MMGYRLINNMMKISERRDTKVQGPRCQRYDTNHLPYNMTAIMVRDTTAGTFFPAMMMPTLIWFIIDRGQQWLCRISWHKNRVFIYMCFITSPSPWNKCFEVEKQSEYDQKNCIIQVVDLIPRQVQGQGQPLLQRSSDLPRCWATPEINFHLCKIVE